MTNRLPHEGYTPRAPHQSCEDHDAASHVLASHHIRTYPVEATATPKGLNQRKRCRPYKT